MKAGMLTETRLARRLFAAFAVTAVAFVLSSVYANWLSVEIERQTEELLGNALPSMRYLTLATDDLRDFEAATDDYPDIPAAERMEARRHIDEIRREIDRSLTTYRTLPRYAGEDALYQDVPPALRRMDASVEHLYADVDAGQHEHARQTADRDVRTRANDTARLLRELVRQNADQAGVSSTSIQETRRHAATAAAVLDAVTVALTIALAVWLWSLFRAFSRLQAEHTKLVEQRAQELEVFGSRVAHDLLAPLSSLTFCLSAFKPAAASDPKLDDAMRRARQCVVRARTLVDGLFDFARSGGEPAPDGRADVGEVVRQVVEEARGTEEGENVEIEVAPMPAWTARCTSGVLSSILGNLLRNAAKFSHDSATRHVWVRAERRGDRVALEVEDTGPGIPDGFERSIFQPYVRAPGVTQPGLGLGLATVKRLCEAHGGEVGVRRASGGGSVFWFTLPLAEEPGDAAASGPRRAAAS
ncbi:MAG TPA: ATP-binding protein [Polyangiaceae bacterium]